jgi:hypothetical protein
MPIGLPAISRALDVVREESTFCEGVITFVHGKLRVIFLESRKDLDGCGKSSWIRRLEDSLSLAGNCQGCQFEIMPYP